MKRAKVAEFRTPADRVASSTSAEVSLEDLDKPLEDLSDVLVEEDITEAEKEEIDEELRKSGIKSALTCRSSAFLVRS